MRYRDETKRRLQEERELQKAYEQTQKEIDQETRRKQDDMRRQFEDSQKKQQEERDLQQALENSYKTKSQEDARRQIEEGQRFEKEQAQIRSQEENQRRLARENEQSAQRQAEQEQEALRQRELSRELQEKHDLEQALQNSLDTKAQEDARQQQISTEAATNSAPVQVPVAVEPEVPAPGQLAEPSQAEITAPVADQPSEGQLVIAGEKIMALQRRIKESEGRNATYQELSANLQTEMNLSTSQANAILDAMDIE